MQVIHLKQTAPGEIRLKWDDGLEASVPLTLVRDACPCAGCKGETVLLRSYEPPPADRAAPGRYDLKGVHPVGGYALQFVWGDGHHDGIYTWEQLREICSNGGAAG